MERKFTFSNSKEGSIEWVNGLFETQEEALINGFELFPEGVLVGQLKSNGENYQLENVYEFTEIK